MAEIKIQEKKRTNPAVIMLVILLLLIAVLLILDATEIISTPNWIDNTVTPIDELRDSNF